jgi:hypothetical protein
MPSGVYDHSKNPGHTGKLHTEVTKMRIRIARRGKRTGNENPQWKESNYSYSAMRRVWR